MGLLEAEGGGAEGAEIGMEAAAGRGLDGADEAAGKDDIARFQALTIPRKPLDKPENPGDGIIEYARAKAGFLDHAIALHDRANPAQVERCLLYTSPSPRD